MSVLDYLVKNFDNVFNEDGLSQTKNWKISVANN